MTIALVQPVDDAVRRIVTIIDQIIELSEKENAELSRGYPPNLAATTFRKRELSTEFELWLAFLRQDHLIVDDAAPELVDALADRMRRMQACVKENLVRLQAAMDARATRIEAVMKAVRAEITPVAQGGAYVPSGRMADPRPASLAAGGVRA